MLLIFSRPTQRAQTMKNKVEQNSAWLKFTLTRESLNRKE